MAVVTIPPLGSDDHRIQIASQVRLFDLRGTGPSKYDPTGAAHKLFTSKGRPVLNFLGSTGHHGPTPHPTIGHSIDLDSPSTLSSKPAHFLYLLHWKASLRLNLIGFLREEESHSKRDHVLTMLISKLADDTFERVGLCGIPIDEWDDAPIADGLESITLV